jgi:predicted permease
MSHELLPVAIGLGVGAVLGGVRPLLPTAIVLLLSVPLGFLVTVITGEFELGWEYLLIDIPLVALSATAAFWTVRLVRGNAWRGSP